MRPYIGNLLKQISVLFFVLDFYFEVNCQKVTHSIYVQGLSYTSTNFQEVNSDKGLLDYNFGYGMNFQNITIYFDKFHANEGRRLGYTQNKILGQMIGYTINSYSVLVGYNLLKIKDLKLISGIGLRYNYGIIGWFDDGFPKPWEATVCHEYSKFGPVLLNELNLKVYKKFSLGILTRFNPMVNKFGYRFVGNDAPCFNEHSKERFNYLSNQLIIKYTF